VSSDKLISVLVLPIYTPVILHNTANPYMQLLLATCKIHICINYVHLQVKKDH